MSVLSMRDLLPGREGRQNQGVNSLLHFRGEGSIDHAMTLYRAFRGKQRRHNRHPVVPTSRDHSPMPNMESAFIAHFKGNGCQAVAQDLGNSVSYPPTDTWQPDFLRPRFEPAV